MKTAVKNFIAIIFFIFSTNPTVFAEWIDPTGLEINKTYELSKGTPLYESSNQEDPADTTGERILNAGTRITVIKKSSKKKAPWYFVDIRKRKTVLYTGWVNSMFLLSQKLKEPKGLFAERLYDDFKGLAYIKVDRNNPHVIYAAFRRDMYMRGGIDELGKAVGEAYKQDSGVSKVTVNILTPNRNKIYSILEIK